jgi:peroxiredoxin
MMNLLKSLYISAYMPVAMAISIYAGWRMVISSQFFAWGGVLLTTIPFLLLIGRLMLFQNVARTGAHFPSLIGLGLLGLAVSLWASLGPGAHAIAPVLALLGWGCFILYSFWYSKLSRSNTGELRLGHPLPTFKVTGIDGQTVSSNSFAGGPAVLIFFRGNWCPLCMAQIKELVAEYHRLESLGVRVALISPQPHENTVKLAAKLGVTLEFYTDEGNSAARALGIAAKYGLPMGMQVLGYESETVLPTVLITDRDGNVVWTHETGNYRIRPEPDVFMDVLRDRGLVTIP